jgi:serine phosphatase RsbU (regulator of sigma subunit)
MDIFEGHRVYSIIEDRHGGYWFGTGNGLHRYFHNSFKSYYNSISDTGSLCSNTVQTILEDSDGIIWVGTEGGFDRFVPETGKFKHYKKKINATNVISDNSVLTIFEDSNKFLWLGTESGLNKFEKKTEKFTPYVRKKDGLKSAYIYSILDDKIGNLWLSTNKGISKFNLVNKSVDNYDLVDGLQSYEYNIGAYYKSKSGELFFGGIHGFNSIHPDSLFHEYIPTSIYITSIKTKYHNTEYEHFKEGKEEYIFSYKDYFTIEFATLEFTHSEKNNYSYLMEGLNDDWIPIGTTNSATFPKIAPGTYVFEVKGTNKDLIWNEETDKVQIIIEPPLWKSNYAYALYIIVVMVLLYLLYLTITKNLRKTNQILKEKQKTAEKISKQKEELSRKNKNITDSLNYAQRIINAMMPSNKLFRKLLPESFVMFKPKDIVSGDFFWIAEKNGKIFIASVDCTGHGIPGAFMSIIGFELLRNIVKIQNNEKPAEILNKLNDGVAEIFRDAEKTNIHDGMDLSFCVLHKNKRIVEYAGAFNPLYIVREKKIIEIRGDRFSVGLATNSDGQRFTNHVIPLMDNDVIYMFTDGYVDQFGGPEGKKFKYRRFRHLLLTIHKMSMKEQRTSLDKSIASWMINHEQIDDILVIGVKP